MADRILLIEDDPSILSLMKTAFEKEGFDTYTADNGTTGIEMFHSVHPDLVITDIVMPEREGMSVIIEVRKSLFDTGLIAISGGGERGRNAYLRWAKELGADLVIRKPFRMSMLLWMARELLEETRGKTAALRTPLPLAPDEPHHNPTTQNR